MARALYRSGEGPCIRKPKAEWQRPEGQFGFGAYKEEPWSLQAIEKRVYAVRDTYSFFLKGTSFNNPGHHDRINEVLCMLRLIVGYKAKHVPKVRWPSMPMQHTEPQGGQGTAGAREACDQRRQLQTVVTSAEADRMGSYWVQALRMSVLTLLQALDKEKLAALLGAADVSNPAVLSVAAFIAKNVVQGNRAAQEWLLDWSDVEVAVREGRVVGLTTEVGQTKVDRLQRGETKPLQCSSTCTGKLEVTVDGFIDACQVCPAHLLLASKAAWAEKLHVCVADVKGGVFADYSRFEELPAGATLVAVDVNSPAYGAKPNAAVLIISKAEEAHGRRYNGSEDLYDGDGNVCRPKMGAMYFEVVGQPYACRNWGDAASAASTDSRKPQPSMPCFACRRRRSCPCRARASW